MEFMAYRAPATGNPRLEHDSMPPNPKPPNPQTPKPMTLKVCRSRSLLCVAHALVLHVSVCRQVILATIALRGSTAARYIPFQACRKLESCKRLALPCVLLLRRPSKDQPPWCSRNGVRRRSLSGFVTIWWQRLR